MERIGVLALAALAPAAMLAVDPGGWFPFGPVKWLGVSTLVLAGAALLSATRPLRALPVPVLLTLAFLLGWLALAATLGEDPLYAWLGTPERRFGVLTWALCGLALVLGHSLDVGTDGRIVVRGLLVAGIGVGAVATAEALGFEPDVLDVGSRLTGTFGSSAYLGAATALLLPIAVGVAVEPGARRRRLPAAAAAVLLVVACFGSGARAAWLGLLVAALLAVLARRRALATLLGRNRRAGVAAAAGAVAVAAGVLALTPVGPRLAALDDDAAGGRGRLDEWRVAIDVAAERPALGAGPEAYRIAFAGGVDRAYVREHGRDQVTDRAHSAPLDVLVTGGVPALVAWLVLVGLVARSAWRLLRRGPSWLAGVAAGLVAHGVGLLAFFPVMELEPVVWLLAGIVLAAGSRPAGAPTGPPDAAGVPEAVGAAGVAGAPDRAAPARLRPVPRPVVALAALAAVAAAVTGTLEVVADRRAGRAADALAEGDATAALERADDAAALRPDVVRLHLLAARAAVAAQQGTLAGLQRVDDALAVSPRDPVALLERARLLVVRADATRTPAHLDAAARALDRRLRADPFHPTLWELEALVRALRGDEDGAEAAERRALELDPDRDRR